MPWRFSALPTVLRGLALNRMPGYHFAGNYLDISYDHVAQGDARLALDAAPHCTEADGQMNLGAFAMLADLTLAATIRAGFDSATRLATRRTGWIRAAGT